MDPIPFKVREICQTASGGSYVVKYSAEAELRDASQPVVVEMVSVYPPGTSADTVELCRQLVQRGVVRALEGTSKSLRLRVYDFVIHPLDFKPSRIEQYTTDAIRRILRELIRADGDRPGNSHTL